mmetsp:Transcript_25386/g.55766  ORF Transcript_25386/g.55766 Transcript_25386/m.55766 type:complete len:148 (+) Transcript_25386:52-495(+)
MYVMLSTTHLHTNLSLSLALFVLFSSLPLSLSLSIGDLPSKNNDPLPHSSEAKTKCAWNPVCLHEHVTSLEVQKNSSQLITYSATSLRKANRKNQYRCNRTTSKRHKSTAAQTNNDGNATGQQLSQRDCSNRKSYLQRSMEQESRTV